MTNTNTISCDVLSAIENEAQIFISKNPNLVVLNKQDLQYFTPMKRHSLINFEGEYQLKIVIFIEEELFQAFVDSYFESIEDDERDEIEEALPDEIINTIVGLAIRHFPEELYDFNLSVPYKLLDLQIENMFDIQETKTKKIDTNLGQLQISLAVLKGK